MIRKIKRNYKNDCFNVLDDVCRMEFFWNTKYRTTKRSQSFVVYKFTCPGFNENYVEKTKKTLYEESVVHALKEENRTFENHLGQCEGIYYLLNLTNLVPALFSNNDNTRVTDNRSF